MLLAVLPMLCAFACSGDNGGGADPVVRDSAGIRIVENGPVANEPAPWRVSAEPVMRIGWDEGDPEFAGVAQGAILGDGRVAVTTYDPRRLFVMSPTGEILDAFGRDGGGPGELGAVVAVLGLGGDTILVQHDRIRFSFVHDGELVRELRITDAARSAVAGATPAGRLVMLPNSGSGIQQHETTWSQAPIVSITRDAEQWDTIGLFEYLPPTADRPTYAPFGSAAVSGERIVVSRNDRTELKWLDETGEPRQIARWQMPARTVTDSVRSALERFMREYYQGPDYENVPATEIERRMAAALDRAYGPLPFHRLVIGDPDGNAWLPGYLVRPGWPNLYAVVSADGRWLGVVQLPGEFKVLDIGADGVLVVEENELDMQAVALYRLEK